MSTVRIGFLVPSYSADSPSRMPIVMRMLADAGVAVDVVKVRDRPIDLSDVRIEHDLYVLKKIDGPALSIAGALHAQGAAIVNPYPATMALRDKIVATRVLQAAGVPTPATYVVSHPDLLAPLLETGALVVKPYNGTGGFGVRVVRSAADLAAVPSGKEHALAQRYHAPDGRDLKIYCIGGRLFGVKKVFPARTEAEKHGEPFTPTPEQGEIALRCGRAFGIDLYGVDIIESDGSPYVVDMSTIPGFKGVPDAPTLLASYLHTVARAATGRAAAGRRGARPLARAIGALAFESVSYGPEPGRPVLHDVSFTIDPATRVGIQGLDGASAGALLDLLTRRHDPTHGRILLDGVDLGDYALDDVRRQVTVVPEEPDLCRATVAENIADMVPGATRDRIVAAAQAANADEFIACLPEAYDTRVGQGGVELTTGQRRRIALARAFLEDRPVLVVVEPVHSSDRRSEAAIRQALKRLERGRTVIVIGRRPATFETCSAVIRMDGGRVVDVTRSAGREAPPAGAAYPATPSAAVRDRRLARLLAHPAVQAWARLTPERLAPRQLSALKPSSSGKGKSAVYLLEGVGDRESAVIAKRCRRADAAIERTVYEEVLAPLEIPSLRYYGCVEDSGGEYAWLFVEEAAGEEYLPLVDAHRAHAGRWLALLHGRTAGAAAGQRLPAAGADRYLAHLRAARARIAPALDNPILVDEDAVFLENLVARLHELEAGWALLEEACTGVPHTLVHGDFSAKNLRVRPSSGGAALAAFDWEDAGWGVPAPDLAQRVVPGSRHGANPDLEAYHAVVRESWPSVTPDAIRRLGHCGAVFRALASMDWDSHQVAHDWAESSVRTLRLYDAEVTHALERLRRPQHP